MKRHSPACDTCKCQSESRDHSLIDETRTFVNGRSRDLIKQDISTRIDRDDVHLERKQAIKV